MAENGLEQSILSDKQRNALVHGATVFIDELFEDFANLKKGWPIELSDVLAEYLPERFYHLYDEKFVKKFIVSAIRIADRLPEWKSGFIPTSTAESLALWAIIQYAKSWLEREGDDEEKDFNLFIDLAFPDLDFELLFDRSFDGIEESDVARKMGMFLKPSEWFDEAYGPVHPFVYE